MMTGCRQLSPKFFTLSLVSFIGGLSILAGGYIFYYDPLMVSGFINANNLIVPVIDARFQKTNKLLHYRADYDVLLIGSSRVEQLRQEDFLPLKVFNYSLPSIYPYEYVYYIDLFLQKNKKKSPVIFLGFDFYGSNSINHSDVNPPDYYIKMCTSLFYVPKILFSNDSFVFARKMSTGIKDTFAYDRVSLNKINGVISPTLRKSLSQNQLETFSSKTYGDYTYNKTYIKMLRDIKLRLNGFNIVIFTTPESNDLFKILVEKGLLNDYERWLTDIVTTFGGVYNFMRPGHLAADHNNFIDEHHLVPAKSAPLVRLMCGKMTDLNGEFNDSFVTGKNIVAHLAKIRHDAETLRNGSQ